MTAATSTADKSIDVLHLRAVSDQLGVHERTIRRWSAEGRFPPPLRLGNRLVWRRSAIAAYLASLESEGAADAR